MTLRKITAVYVLLWVFLFLDTRNIYKYASMPGVPDPTPVAIQNAALRILPFATAALPLFFLGNALLYTKKRKKDSEPA